MKWVTRERRTMDQIACPWLILRLIELALPLPATRSTRSPDSLGLLSPKVAPSLGACMD
jgi:hypothetical protein